MKSARSVAVAKTWRNKKTREKRLKACKEACTPEVIARRVAGTKKFWVAHPDKKRGGGRPKGTPQSKEVRKRIGIGAKKVWSGYSSKEKEARVLKVSKGQIKLWSGPEGERLRKISSRCMKRNWANKNYREIVSKASAKAHIGRKHSKEEIELRRQGLLLCYREGRHPGSGPNGWHKQEYKGVVYSSSYEVVFAKWCNRYKVKFQYQPKRFNLVVNGTYRPDFYLPDQDFWVETKGAFLSDPLAKYFEFKERYPEGKRIVLLDKWILEDFLDDDLLVEAKILKKVSDGSNS